jgi:hypothetical protein
MCNCVKVWKEEPKVEKDLPKITSPFGGPKRTEDQLVTKSQKWIVNRRY